MAIFKQYQIVELANDLPEQGVTRGTPGTILEVYDAPGETEAYELEVADEAGRSVLCSTVSVIAPAISPVKLNSQTGWRRGSDSLHGFQLCSLDLNV